MGGKLAHVFIRFGFCLTCSVLGNGELATSPGSQLPTHINLPPTPKGNKQPALAKKKQASQFI